MFPKCVNTNNVSIVIIGAGAAGIAAASKLMHNDYSNIIILEAENRIGGRIHSTEYGGGIIELGAETCHGENKNIVYELVKDFNFLDDTEIPIKLYHSSGKPCDEDFIEELFDLFYNIYYGEKKPSENITLGEYLINEYNSQVNEKYKNDTEKLHIAEEFLFFAEKYVISNEGTFTWFDLSASNEYEETEGNQELSWKGMGYKILLDMLMSNFTDISNTGCVKEKIKVNKEVIEIKWHDNLENNNKATIFCSDNSSYTADHVIVTVSLGVLKDSYKTLFSPNLPTEKVNAIEDLGIQAVTKIFLHFPVKWWPQNKELHANFIWSKEDRLQVLEDFPFGPQKNNESWLTDIAGIYTVPKNPNVLQAWCVGRFIPDIELLENNIITDGIMFVIKKFMNYDYPDISTPDSIIRYNWYSNPHFRGSYSFETVKSRGRSESVHTILSEPLKSVNGTPTVLFAGEATSTIHYATVNGAVETGFREANRILNFYNHKNTNV